MLWVISFLSSNSWSFARSWIQSMVITLAHSSWLPERAISMEMARGEYSTLYYCSWHKLEQRSQYRRLEELSAQWKWKSHNHTRCASQIIPRHLCISWSSTGARFPNSRTRTSSSPGHQIFQTCALISSLPRRRSHFNSCLHPTFTEMS